MSKRHSHHGHPPHDRDTIIGWNLYEYVAQPLLLLPQRVALIVKENAPPPDESRQFQKGGASFNFRPAGRKGGTYMSVMYLWPRGWSLSMSNHPTCSK